MLSVLVPLGGSALPAEIFAPQQQHKQQQLLHGALAIGGSSGRAGVAAAPWMHAGAPWMPPSHQRSGGGPSRQAVKQGWGDAASVSSEDGAAAADERRRAARALGVAAVMPRAPQPARPPAAAHAPPPAAPTGPGIKRPLADVTATAAEEAYPAGMKKARGKRGPRGSDEVAVAAAPAHATRRASAGLLDNEDSSEPDLPPPLPAAPPAKSSSKGAAEVEVVDPKGGVYDIQTADEDTTEQAAKRREFREDNLDGPLVWDAPLPAPAVAAGLTPPAILYDRYFRAVRSRNKALKALRDGGVPAGGDAVMLTQLTQQAPADTAPAAAPTTALLAAADFDSLPDVWDAAFGPHSRHGDVADGPRKRAAVAAAKAALAAPAFGGREAPALPGASHAPALRLLLGTPAPPPTGITTAKGVDTTSGAGVAVTSDAAAAVHDPDPVAAATMEPVAAGAGRLETVHGFRIPSIFRPEIGGFPYELDEELGQLDVAVRAVVSRGALRQRSGR